MNRSKRRTGYKHDEDTSLVLSSAGCAKADDVQTSKPVRQLRGENTGDRPGRMSAHSVFVLGVDGKPLMPTTPAKARRLLAAGVAKHVWSKFGTFGVQLDHATRNHTVLTTLGYDVGTKCEGMSVVVGMENVLNVKLDLPDKKKIVRKLEERRILRRARRFRNCRRRPCRSDNRSRVGFLAPSQRVLVQSRLKVIGELCRMYPVTLAGVEDVKFNHAARKWGSNFSTMEIGKQAIRQWFTDSHITVAEYQGYETQELRKAFGYRKIKDKSADRFESHCCDSLTLACDVGFGEPVSPGPLVVVDDTYRPIRRKLHDTQPAKNSVRERYSTGTVVGLRKGLLIGTASRTGRLCGIINGSLRYHDRQGKRQTIQAAAWISSQFITRSGDSSVV